MSNDSVSTGRPARALPAQYLARGPKYPARLQALFEPRAKFTWTFEFMIQNYNS